ncbi:glycosyltransferase family 4 protein [Elusimicrobiota bacterium]
MRKVRVLHIITRLILGGAQQNTLLTAIGQHKNPCYDVTLLIGLDHGPEGDLIREAKSSGLRVVINPDLVRPIHPVKDLLAYRSVRKFIENGKYDIVHTHSSKAGIVGRLAAYRGKVPCVIHTLHSLVFHKYQSRWKNMLYIVLKRICAPMTDHYISVCDAVTKGALEKKIGDPGRYTTVYSGMDLIPFLEAPSLSQKNCREEIGLDPARFVIGKIARLFSQKGHEHFLEMAAQIYREDPSVQFLIVGNGILLEKLTQMAKSMGIDSAVKFAGLVAQERIPRYIQAMDILVHASVREGIPRVLPQALAAGKPVIAFDMDGNPEVIEDGRTGFLIAPTDNSAMAKKAISLLRDPCLQATMGNNGREFVLRNFSLKTMIERIDSVYKLVSKRKGLKLFENGTHE